jgi:hypothetical protein
MKISSGYYRYEENGFTISVTRSEVDGEVVWYNGIELKGKKLFEGSDYFPTKKEALESIKYVANHPKEYGI